MTEFLKTLVKNTIEEWVGSQRMFTIFDITAEVRNLVGKDIEVPHYGKDGVRDYALKVLESVPDMDEWHTMIYKPKNSAARPVLYYHETQDPKDYVPVGIEEANHNPLAPVPPNSVQVAEMVNTKSCIMRPVSDNRICINKELLQSINLEDHGVVEVVPNPNDHSIRIVRGETAGSTYVVNRVRRKRIVDSSNRLRISRDLLNSVGIADKSSYVATICDENSIEIRSNS